MDTQEKVPDRRSEFLRLSTARKKVLEKLSNKRIAAVHGPRLRLQLEEIDAQIERL